MTPPERRTGPADNGTGSRISVATKTSEKQSSPFATGVAATPMHLTAARRSWAYRLIRRCASPPPPYGSAEWLRLPEGSPERVAAVVAAAESWVQGKDDLPEDLAREIDEVRRVNKQLDDAEYVDRYRAHRSDWRHLRVVAEPYADRRARELAEAGPRPDDFEGRGSA